jgi:hypothetical protein
MENVWILKSRSVTLVRLCVVTLIPDPNDWLVLPLKSKSAVQCLNWYSPKTARFLVMKNFTPPRAWTPRLVLVPVPPQIWPLSPTIPAHDGRPRPEVQMQTALQGVVLVPEEGQPPDERQPELPHAEVDGDQLG